MDDNSTTVYEAEYLRPVLTYFPFVATGTTLVCLLVSFLFNTSTFCAVWGNPGLRRYGYYHLLILFSEAHLAYFVLKAFHQVVDTLDRLDLLSDDPGFAAFVADISPFTEMVPDILMCVFGTSLLLLTAMTVDVLVANSVRSGALVKCSRSFWPLLALSTGVAIFLAVFVVKFGHFYGDRLDLGEGAVILIVYGLYLLVFSLLPSFFIVIVGAVNWVSDLNSGRPLKEARRTSRKLDHRLCVVSVFVLLLFLVATIMKFSMALQVYQSKETSEITNLVTQGLEVLTDVFYAPYPVVFVCMLGKFCCCLEEHV